MIRSFPPVSDSNSRVLILGSIPGIKSLEAKEYYAHPMNQFWKILYELFQKKQESDYQKKIAFLLQHRIALWDVIQLCERQGSSDNQIQNIILNDFQQFFSIHSSIHAIFFNGTKARDTFQKYVGNCVISSEVCFSLPSTSPANTNPCSMKLNRWRSLIDWL